MSTEQSRRRSMGRDFTPYDTRSLDARQDDLESRSSQARRDPESTKSNYRHRPNNLRRDFSASSSFDNDNIIHEFDEYIVNDDHEGDCETPLILPKSNRRLSNNNKAESFDGNQSNKSLSGSTSTFHTAIEDIITSSSDYQTARNSLVLSPSLGQNFLWISKRTGNQEQLLAMPDFEVFWSNINYEISPTLSIKSIASRMKKCLTSCKSDEISKITILNDVSGSFRSSELTALMGPSGSGKTSLLNFLSRRREQGYSGKLYSSDKDRRLKISTIPQDDSLPEYLTVRENLLFASRLKNTEPNFDHDANIMRVSGLLGLEACLYTRTKKISGGELKRLAIAQELLSKPDILILDEPTSGLDSLTCYNTVTVLKNLVQASAKKLIDPIAIVVSIHQPEQEVFDLFDRVYLMAPGGRAIYDGRPEACAEYIDRSVNIKLPSEDYNPALLLIEIASGEHGNNTLLKLEQNVKDSFQSNHLLGNNQNSTFKEVNNTQPLGNFDIEQHGKQALPKNRTSQTSKNLTIDSNIVPGSRMNSGHFMLKTRILTERCWISVVRDPKQLVVRSLFHIMLPIGLGVIGRGESGVPNACPRYYPSFTLRDTVKNESLISEDIQDELLLTMENFSMLFMLIYCLVTATIAALTLSFTLDIQRSLKEFNNGWYSMQSYLIARLLADLPMQLILPVVSLVLMYVTSGQLKGIESLHMFRLSVTAVAFICVCIIGQAFGMIFGAIYIGHITTALFVAQGATIPFVFISGFVVRTTNMSKFIYILSFLSFYRHSVEITMLARYGFDICRCNESMITGKDPEMLGVPDKLRQLTKFWMLSLDDMASDPDYKYSYDNTTMVTTTTPAPESDSDDGELDLFQMFAKQIFLYNTHGIDIKSCKDVHPYPLIQLSVTDKDLKPAMFAIILYLIVIELILFLTVKLVIRYKTSL